MIWGSGIAKRNVETQVVLPRPLISRIKARPMLLDGRVLTCKERARDFSPFESPATGQPKDKKEKKQICP
jgi:hypothetical protein